VSNYERSCTRDLTFSLWHRTLPGHYTAIDVDFLEYCGACSEPLALLETTADRRRPKPTAILGLLATRSRLPAYLIYVDSAGVVLPDRRSGRERRRSSGRTVVGASVHPITTAGGPLHVTEPELSRWLLDLHDDHLGHPCAGAVAAANRYRKWGR
jgi:hypothetical protein